VCLSKSSFSWWHNSSNYLCVQIKLAVNSQIKNYKFERVENFKYLGVIPNEDNNNQTDLQERMKNANKT